MKINYGDTKKGIRLARKENIFRTHSKITVPQWGRICMNFYHCREAVIEKNDRSYIKRFFDADTIIQQ